MSAPVNGLFTTSGEILGMGAVRPRPAFCHRSGRHLLQRRPSAPATPGNVGTSSENERFTIDTFPSGRQIVPRCAQPYDRRAGGADRGTDAVTRSTAAALPVLAGHPKRTRCQGRDACRSAAGHPRPATDAGRQPRAPVAADRSRLAAGDAAPKARAAPSGRRDERVSSRKNSRCRAASGTIVAKPEAACGPFASRDRPGAGRPSGRSQARHRRGRGPGDGQHPPCRARRKPRR